MSRTCLIDEAHVQPAFDELVRSRAPAEVGLLLGKLEVGSRDFVLGLVPAPIKDCRAGGAFAPSSYGNKNNSNDVGGAVSGVPITFDEDWIVEHSLQVSRMLHGGIEVVGLYCFGSDAEAKKTIPALHVAAIEVAKAGTSGVTAHANRLILHLSATSRKYAVKRFAIESGICGGLSPVEVKLGCLLNNFLCVESKYLVDTYLACHSAVDFRSAAQELIEREAVRIQHSEVVLAGTILTPNEVMADVLGSMRNEGKGVGAATVHAELLIPAKVASSPGLPPLTRASWSKSPTEQLRSISMTPLTGLTHIYGVICARAYVYNRETVARAVADLKEDIIGSLKVRLSLLIDEAEGEGDKDYSQSDKESEEKKVAHTVACLPIHPLVEGNVPLKHKALALPRRVLVSWHNGLYACDYLQSGEELGNVVERCWEVLTFNINEADLVDIEAEADLSHLALPRLCRVDSMRGAKSYKECAHGATKKHGVTVVPCKEIAKLCFCTSSLCTSYATVGGIALVTIVLANMMLENYQY